MAAARHTNLILYRRLLRQVRPYWLHLGGILLLSLMSTPLALLTPLPLKVAVDTAIGSQPLPSFLEGLLPAAARLSDTTVLALVAGLAVVIALLSGLEKFGSWWLRTYTGEKMILSFRSQLFRHAQCVSLAYHDTKGTTDSIYRIQHDAPSIQNVAINGVITFITDGLKLAGMIYVTARIDWQLALLALAVSPILFLLLRTCNRRLRQQWFSFKGLESSAMSVVQEVLASIRVVKAFGQEDRERERFMQHSSKSMWGQIQVAYTKGGFELFVGLTIAMGTAAALFLGVLHVQSDILTLGELLMVMSYLSQLYVPLETLSREAATLQSSLASAERAFALLDEEPDVVERPSARRLVRASGSVAFRNVSFAYDKDRPVLHNISFDIGPGSRVGIAGKTGAGKTTLVSLLMRFYDPTTGHVLLDGVDLRDYKLADLRDQFAIVLQEPLLFSTSIAENIAYVCPNASPAEIVKAAKAANAQEFIMDLPDGYDTLVGYHGMRLSGGERQRIALARAFLKDAAVLILDEPTSSVDMKTEAGIMEAMECLMHGRTTFIIAHRLNILKNCNLRLQIEDGRLVEMTSSTPKTTSMAQVNVEYNVTSAETKEFS